MFFFIWFHFPSCLLSSLLIASSIHVHFAANAVACFFARHSFHSIIRAFWRLSLIWQHDESVCGSHNSMRWPTGGKGGGIKLPAQSIITTTAAERKNPVRLTSSSSGVSLNTFRIWSILAWDSGASKCPDTSITCFPSRSSSTSHSSESSVPQDDRWQLPLPTYLPTYLPTCVPRTMAVTLAIVSGAGL